MSRQCLLTDYNMGNACAKRKSKHAKNQHYQEEHNHNQEDLWDDQDWDDFRRKSHGLWDGTLESNEERTRLAAVSLDILAPSSSPRLRGELEEWVEEGRRRMAMEDMYGRYSIEPCRHLGPQIVGQIKRISSTLAEEDVDQDLRQLLKEEAAKEVVGGRSTIPKTLPAKKQLAIDILMRKGRALAEQDGGRTAG